MRSFFKRINKKFLLIIAVVGPSIVTTMAGNDGGGVITYSLAGANFGFGLLILLPFLGSLKRSVHVSRLCQDEDLLI